jgi:hypothetical protein
MCSPATCRKCQKVTWSGCGQHVDQVLARVPKAQQCTCRDDERSVGAGSLLSRLLGR